KGTTKKNSAATSSAKLPRDRSKGARMQAATAAKVSEKAVRKAQPPPRVAFGVACVTPFGFPFPDATAGSPSLDFLSLIIGPLGHPPPMRSHQPLQPRPRPSHP